MLQVILSLSIIIIILLFLNVSGQKENFKKKEIKGGITFFDIKYKHRIGHSTVYKLNGNSNENIVLIHNTPLGSRVWEPLILKIQDKFNSGDKIPNIYAYDTLGHRTAWVQVPPIYNDNNMKNYAWDYEVFVRDLKEIHENFINDKFTLVGYGTGGSIAQAFSLKYPDLIKKLYVLGTTIGPTEKGIFEEVNKLVKWINEHGSKITYLTLNDKFVEWSLCRWFENNNSRQCPDNINDKMDTSSSPEYILGRQLFLTGNSVTTLQTNKFLNSIDLRDEWSKTNISFPVFFLIADRDEYTDINTTKNDIQLIKKVSPDSKLYIIKEKHGFALTQPDYIYDFIMGKDVSKKDITIEII